MPERLKPIDKLMAAMDRCAIARGEAQWTHGYRTGIVKTDPTQGDRLWERERAQWEKCGAVENRFRRLAKRLLREARDA